MYRKLLLLPVAGLASLTAFAQPAPTVIPLRENGALRHGHSYYESFSRIPSSSDFTSSGPLQSA